MRWRGYAIHNRKKQSLKNLGRNRGKTFFEKLGPEDHVQHACIEYAKAEHKLELIPMNTENKRGKFAAYRFKYLGGKVGIVDLFIPYPTDQYHGLFVELKTEDRKVTKPDGTLYAANAETHAAQIQNLEDYTRRGYGGVMCFGFDDFKRLIDFYAKHITIR